MDSLKDNIKNNIKDKLKEIDARTKLTRQLVNALTAGLNIDDIKRALRVSAQLKRVKG